MSVPEEEGSGLGDPGVVGEGLPAYVCELGA